jgi:hypothetical protein
MILLTCGSSSLTISHELPVTASATRSAGSRLSASVLIPSGVEGTKPADHTLPSSQIAISVVSADANPLSGVEASTVQYYAGTAAVPVTSSLTISAPDDTTLAGATVSISSGLVPTEDALNFTNQNGTTGSYNASTGVLTLTGTSSVANYQAALRSITYNDPNGATPSTGHGRSPSRSTTAHPRTTSATSKAVPSTSTPTRRRSQAMSPPEPTRTRPPTSTS